MTRLEDQDAAHAVLTGDIAGSSALPGDIRAELPEKLRGIGAFCREVFPEAVARPIDVFRGDSWQLFVEEPRQALDVAVYLRASLRAGYEDARVDTRIGIGIGSVDFVPDERVSGGDGEAFRLSGQALDQLGRPFGMAVAAETALVPSTAAALDAIAKLIDAQIVQWTQRQAFAVSHALRGWTQEEIGEAWIDRPISQQTVAQHLAAAGWHAIQHALSVASTIIEPAGTQS